MRKVLLLLIITFLTFFINAQDDMPLVWKTKLGHNIIYHGTGLEERGYSFAASDKEITVFQNEDGKTIWTESFKELTPELSKIDELIPFWKANIILLFDRKPGKDQITCIDIENGKLLWTTGKYQKVTEDVVIYIPEKDVIAISLKKKMVIINARTGEEIWSTARLKGVIGKYIYNKDDRTMVLVNFVPDGLKAFFSEFKNQIVRIDMENGEILWENTFIGKGERKILTKDFVYNLDVHDGKIFLLLDGMQVYDYNTGTNLWSAAFQFTCNGIVKKPSGTKRFGVYKAVADPVIVGDDIYILDMTGKKNKCLKKYNLQTGKLLWASKEIKGAWAIPGMELIGDKIMLQIGGKVETQYYRVYKSGDYMIYKWGKSLSEVNPFGVLAFNISDGSLAWQSDKFIKGITNTISFGKYYIVSSGEYLYSIDINTGAEIYEVPVSKGGVGQAVLILKHKDDVIVVIGEKGISTFKAANGEFICSGKYKASELEDMIDDIVIMKTDKVDIAAFDLNTCNYKQSNAKAEATITVSKDGKYVYIYETKVVSKVKTR